MTAVMMVWSESLFALPECSSFTVHNLNYTATYFPTRSVVESLMSSFCRGKSFTLMKMEALSQNVSKVFLS